MKIMMNKSAMTYFLAAVLLMIASHNTVAGFRAVRGAEPGRVIQNSAADQYTRTTKSMANRPISQVSIVRSQGVMRTQSKSGVTDQIELEPEESVMVEIRRENLKPGNRVFAFTLHGGRINGKLTESLVVDDEGKLSFEFSANQWFGNYPVVLRMNGQDEEVSFWVKRQEESR